MLLKVNFFVGGFVFFLVKIVGLYNMKYRINIVFFVKFNLVFKILFVDINKFNWMCYVFGVLKW